MTPKDQNLLSVLNLLVLLFQARKQAIPNLTEEEQHALVIKQEHLDKSKITLPVFHNTLKLLDKRGYLMATSVIEDNFHKKVKELRDSYGEVCAQIPNPNAQFFSIEGKNKLAEKFKAMLPPQYSFDTDGFLQEAIPIKDFLNEMQNALEKHQDDTISYVFLWPFRSIETLLEKLNDGQSFEDVQDSGVWYESGKCEFHVGNDVISTSYQGKPNAEHYVLEKISGYLADGVVGYEEIDTHKPRALKDALRRFVGKHKRLEEIFTVRSDRLDFDRKAFE